MASSLQDALRHHQSGELEQAAQLYRDLLTADPTHADAYHLLGVLMHQLQHSEIAVDLISHAIRLNDRFAPYHNNLGNALLSLGRREDARASFQRSINLLGDPDTYINLATLDLGAGRLQDAKRSFQAAYRLAPAKAECLAGLGRIAMKEGQFASARRRLAKALSIRADCTPALNLLGDLEFSEGNLATAERLYLRAGESSPSDIDAHLNLGTLYMRTQKYEAAAHSYLRAHQLAPGEYTITVLLGTAYLLDEDAEKSKALFLRAIHLQPLNPASHQLLGSALALGRDYEAALRCFKHSLTLDPQLHEAMNGMGKAYDGLGDYSQAAVAFESALALQPQNASYLLSVGLSLARQGQVQSIAILEQAVSRSPDDAAAHIMLAESLLLFGNYERGFAEYEWRWRSPSFSMPHHHYNAPLWDGTPLSGNTILIHAEQGLGDTIQFIRFIPQVARLGGKIILMVQRPLFRLFEALDCIDLCLTEGTEPLPAFDFQCPLLSLPTRLGTHFETIPPPIDLGHALTTVPSTPDDTVLRVGLAWAGNPNHKRDSLRSLPLAALLPLRSVPDCRFFSLQKDFPPSDEPAEQSFHFDGEDLTGLDLLDTANLIASLDLVISVDTAVGHLAANLGKKVWLVLPEAPDWRWGPAGDATPWYRTVTLFRKLPGKTTDDLVELLVDALKHIG